MNTRFAFALILLFVAVAIGCKKRGGTGRTGEDAPGAPQGDTLPPPPATYPNTVGGKVAKALDADAVHMAKNERGVLFEDMKQIGTELPKTGRVHGIDASADRELIDAAFARWWRQTQRLPDRNWENLIDQNGRVTAERKLGTYEEGRAKGMTVFKKPFSTRVTTAGDAEIPGEYGEVNVSGGTGAKWSSPGHLSVTGRVEFRDSLELQAGFGASVAKLEGAVGEVRLTANFPPCCGDFVSLKAQAVVVGPGSVLRVGPSVAAVRYEGLGGYTGVLLLRGLKEMAIPKSAAPLLTVIRY
jgi:hypothetical protein